MPLRGILVLAVSRISAIIFNHLPVPVASCLLARWLPSLRVFVEMALKRVQNNVTVEMMRRAPRTLAVMANCVN